MGQHGEKLIARRRGRLGLRAGTLRFHAGRIGLVPRRPELPRGWRFSATRRRNASANARAEPSATTRLITTPIAIADSSCSTGTSETRVAGPANAHGTTVTTTRANSARHPQMKKIAARM